MTSVQSKVGFYLARISTAINGMKRRTNYQLIGLHAT